MYSIVVPFAVILVAIISSARAFGGEVEARTIGLVMSTPTRRSRLAAHKLIAMVVHVTLAAGLTALGTWIGVAVMGLDLSLGGIVAITFMLALLSVAAGSLAMLVSVATGRGNLAILVTALVAVAAYAWSSFVPLADPIADLAWLSPWHHYIGTDPITEGVDPLSAAWLAILAAVPMILGVRVFRRRDIPA
jgi:ABC-2 type transport system permease protein